MHNLFPFRWKLNIAFPNLAPDILCLASCGYSAWATFILARVTLNKKICLTDKIFSSDLCFIPIFVAKIKQNWGELLHEINIHQFTRNVWVSIGAAESYNVSVSCVGSPCNWHWLFRVPAPQSQKNRSCRMNSTSWLAWQVLIQFTHIAFLSVVLQVRHLKIV